MAFLHMYDLAKSSTFRTRVMITAVSYAAAVIVEAQGEREDAHQSKRYLLAQRVLSQPESMIDSFIWGMVANSTIAQNGLDSTDGDLLFQMTQIWDSVAGVSATDKLPPEPPITP